jgi:eukaryotic-like serine/threonine-protein kinase
MTCPYDLGAIVPSGRKRHHYRLVSRLGDGASAFVFEADQLSAKERRPRERVAFKLFRQSISPEQFETECGALHALTHPGIVRILSYGFTGDSLRLPYVVMPLLRGGSLRTTLDGHGAFTLARSIDYAIEIFAALERAHAAELVHRDLRPSNIFLERIAPSIHRVVLLDFGLLPQSVSCVPPALGLLGHPAYAAPELFYGKPHSVSTDIYAAGLVFYEMLTGTHALGSTSHDWAYTHYFSIAPSLDSLLRTAPPALVDFVASVLAKVVRLRPPSAKACALALSAIQEELLVPSPNSTSEDGVDSLLRRLAGPASDEDTQIEGPPSQLLRQASDPDDTDECPPPASCNWPISSRPAADPPSGPPSSR